MFVLLYPTSLHLQLFPAMHPICDGDCRSKEDYKCNNGSVIEATWGKLFNIILFSFVILVPRNPIHRG